MPMNRRRRRTAGRQRSSRPRPSSRSDPQSIPLTLKVNGELRQRSDTADMIFPVAEILSYLSRFVTLLPGDVVITGTPAGVGLGMKPPRFLQRGDEMLLDGGPLGTQRQRLV